MAPKILIVDDSNTVRMQVKNALVAAGFEVVEAADGNEGLARLESVADLAAVVCDINMPNMSGLELLERVPASASHVPFVMLTTEGQPALMQRARAHGAKGWLVKPFKPDLLVAAMRKLTMAPAASTALPA